MISKRVNDESFSKRLENLYWKRNPSWDLEFKKFDDEKFKEVDGYYGFYFISNYGQVISFYNKTPYIRKYFFENGYYYILLCFLRIGQYFPVHELVYSHFIAPIEEGKKVIHRNGVTTDNYYKNLQLVLASTKRKQYKKKLLDFSLYNRMQDETVNRTLKTVPVLQFDKNGKFLKEFPSLTAAAMSSCTSTSQIARCCSVRKCIGAGFQWRYKDDPIFKDGMIDIEHVSNLGLLHRREILQFDLDGNFIREYASIMDACRNTGASHDKILACLRENSKSTHGYQWRYKNDPIFKNRITNIDPVIYSYKYKSEPVLQFNLKGDLLREFDSIAEASKLTGIFYDNIIRCLKRKSKTAEGYQWFFKKDLKNKKKVSPVKVRGKPKNRQNRTVLQFDLDGSYIKEYPSPRGAALELNISYSSLMICLSKKGKSTGGFQWKYKDDPLFENGIKKIDPISRKINKNSHPVLKFDLNGNFLNEYTSIHKAARKAGVTASQIIKCVKGELKTLGGFMWRTKEKSNIHQKENIKKIKPLQREQRNHPRSVLQFDLEGNFINRFSSIVEAAKGIGTSSVIIKCLKGFSTTAYGYQWRYENDVIFENGFHGHMKIAGVKYPKKPLSKPALQFGIDGKFIREYSSAGNAARKTGIPKSCISRCLRRKSKTAGGFQWRYKKDPYFDKGIKT